MAPKGIYAVDGDDGADDAQALARGSGRAGRTTNYVMRRLDSLFDTPPVLLDDLAKPPFLRYRWTVRQSGTRVPGTLANALEDLWEPRRNAAAPPRRTRR